MSNLLIRPAILLDSHAMMELADRKRKTYEAWQPLFHKSHPEARGRHWEFIKDQLRSPDWILLVADRAGEVEGWIMARLAQAPPVYEPGGKICMVDDFLVRDESLWSGVGSGLLMGCWDRAKAQGAVLLNVVCGPKDEAKRKLLAELKLSVASEWWVGAP